MNPSEKTSLPAPKPTRIWLGFAEKRRTSRGTVKIKLNWGRVSILFISLCIMAWGAKTVGLYIFFKKVRNFEEVTVVDMLAFPLNRDSLRRQQGDYQIEQAEIALKDGDFRRALVMLQQGITRSPANLEGRIRLIQLYMGWRTDLALQLLENGSQYGQNDEDFIRTYCTLLLQQKKDQELLDLTDQILSDPSRSSEVRRIAAISRMQVEGLLGNFQNATDIYQTEELYKSMDGILLATDIMSRIGDEAKAAGLLEAIIRQFREHSMDVVFRRLVINYRNQGKYNQAREKALEYTIRNPMKWEPRILLAETLAIAGDDERLNREVESILRQYRHEEPAMLALGQIAADKGKVRVASRLYELALENNFNLGTFSLLLIESYVMDGRFSEAIGFCNEIVRENPEWLGRMESVFNGIRSLAYFGAGNTELGNLYLNDFRTSRLTNVSQMMQAARAFEKFGFDDAALGLLQEAYRREAQNEQALARLINLKMKVGDTYDLNPMVTSLLQMRRPSHELLSSIQQAFASDRFIFTPNRSQLIRQLQDVLREFDIEGLDLLPPQARQQTS